MGRDRRWDESSRSVSYETPIDTQEELVARLAEAATIVRETPGCFERVVQ